MSTVDPVVKVLADLDHPATPTAEFQDALLVRLLAELRPAGEPRPREGRLRRVHFLPGVPWRYGGRRRLIALAAAVLVVVLGAASAFGTVQRFLFSPGANWKIAYLHNPRANCCVSELYVMNADGSGQTRLARGGSAGAPSGGVAWSPDGRKIAFARWRDHGSDLFVVNVDGSGLRGLTQGAAQDAVPAWSPDGRQIAFSRGRDGNSEVYVMNADGSGRRNLTRNVAQDDSPAWSPNGEKIAFVSTRDGKPDGLFPPETDIHVINADGSGQQNLTRNPARDRHPVWSPDGQKIAFERVV